jgi:hypothetical protein
MFFGLVLLIGTCGGGVMLMNVCVMCHHQTQFDAALVLIGLGFPSIIFEKMMMSLTYRRYDAISVDFHTYQFFQKMKPLIALDLHPTGTHNFNLTYVLLTARQVAQQHILSFWISFQPKSMLLYKHDDENAPPPRRPRDIHRFDS